MDIAFRIEQELLMDGIVVHPGQDAVIVKRYKRIVGGKEPVLDCQWTIRDYAEWETLREEIQSTQDLSEALQIYRSMENEGLTDEEQYLVKQLQQALSARQLYKCQSQ